MLAGHPIKSRAPALWRAPTIMGGKGDEFCRKTPKVDVSFSKRWVYCFQLAPMVIYQSAQVLEPLKLPPEKTRLTKSPPGRETISPVVMSSETGKFHPSNSLVRD